MNMTIAARAGRIHVCLVHNETGRGSIPTRVKKNKKETKARMAASQNGKKPGPG